MRLNERQAAEIQRAIAAADDADSATCIVRAQMERVRMQFEAQAEELLACRQQLKQTSEQLQAHQRDSGVRVQELQSQRDAMAKALRQSRLETDTALREAQETSSRVQFVEAALASAKEQLDTHEAAKAALVLQQRALLQQQTDLAQRERVADDSCRNFAAARAESQAAAVALKKELSACMCQLQQAQDQLNMVGGSQGVMQRLNEKHRQLLGRGKAASKMILVTFLFCCRNHSLFCNEFSF